LPATMTVTVHPDDTTLPLNEPPTSSIYNLEVLGNGSSAPVRIIESDPDGDDEGLNFAILVDPMFGQITQTDDYFRDGIRYWYRPNYPVVTPDSFQVNVTDQDGLSADPPITVNISQIMEPITNVPPVLNGDNLTVDLSDFGNNLIIDLNEYLTDEDDSQIRYIVVNEVETNGIRLSLINNSRIRAFNSSNNPSASGVITIIAVDIYGRESNEASFTINFVD